MKLTARDGTVRIEDNGNSFAWPLYMSIPTGIDNTFLKNIANKLKLAQAGDSSINIEFCECAVKVDNVEVDPANIPLEAKSVCDVIYSHNDGMYAEIYDLRQLKDVPDKPKTKKKDVIEIIKGIPTIVERDVTVMEKKEVIDKDGKRTGQFVDVPVIIKGKKVSQVSIDRLAELISVSDQ